MKKVYRAAYCVLVLLLIPSVVGAVSYLFPYQGGTGVGTAPSSGQVLIGNTSSTYTPAFLTEGTNIEITTSSGGVSIGTIADMIVNSLTATSATIGTLTIPTLVLDPLYVGTSTVLYGDSGTHSYFGATSLSVGTSTDGGLFTVASSSANTYPLVITDAGNVGIGTTIPAYTLDVVGTTRLNTLNGVLKGTTGVLGTATAGTDYQLPYWILSGSNLYASTTTWNVGIATSSPSYKLDVNGSFRVASTTVLNGRVGIGTTTPPHPFTVANNSSNYIGISDSLAVVCNGSACPSTEQQFVMGTETGTVRLPATAGATFSTLGDANGEVGIAVFPHNATSSVDLITKFPPNYIASSSVVLNINWYSTSSVATSTYIGAAYSCVSQGELLNPALSAYATSTVMTNATSTFRNVHAITVTPTNCEANDKGTFRFSRLVDAALDHLVGIDMNVEELDVLFPVGQ